MYYEVEVMAPARAGIYRTPLRKSTPLIRHVHGRKADLLIEYVCFLIIIVFDISKRRFTESIDLINPRNVLY